MKSAYQKLQKAEQTAYQIWKVSIREIDNARRNCQNATSWQKREAEALADMASAASASAFDHWLNICDALDALESQNARDPRAEY
jgi:hypothetical protein